MYRISLFAALLLTFCACSNNENQPAAETAEPPEIWVQYKVWAEEGDSLVAGMLQFFTDSTMEQTLRLEQPSGIALDGQQLAADSAAMVGAYYEFQAPAQQFAGTHQLKFTDLDKNVFTDNFSFYPFRLDEKFPAVLSVQDHRLELDGIPDGSAVRVVLTDISGDGQGINELVQVNDGSVLLPAAYWQQLAPGPVIVHLSAEEERPLESRLQGQLLVTYGVSRVVELKR